MNPGGVPTGIRTHDLWRGRQVRFQYTMTRCGCIPAFLTTRRDFHRLCLDAPLCLIASTTQTDRVMVDRWRRACRLCHQKKCDVGVTCVSGMLLPVRSPGSRAAHWRAVLGCLRACFSMRCTSAMLRGVYGRGLMSGVTGSSPAPTSVCDLLSILSTSALPKGVYGSGLNTGVPGVSCTCASLCGVPPPPPRCRGGVF